MHPALRTAALVVALTAFVGVQLAPANWLPEDAPGTDKQWHAALYFGFALLLWVMVPAPVPQRIVIILTLGTVIGIAMEVFQNEIPGRNPDKADAIADMVGLGAAVVAATIGRLTDTRQ